MPFDAELDDLLRIVLELHPADLLPVISGLKSRADFWGYQRILVELIKRCVVDAPDKLPGLLAALEPGAGKTAVVLTAIRDLLDAGIIRRALIVAPLLVAQTVWPAEIGEWSHLAATTHTLIRVEDDDTEMAEVGAAVYSKALARYQAKFTAEVDEASRRNPSRASALAIVRARWEDEAREAMSDEDKAKKRKPKATPGDFAERERAAAVAVAKDAKLARLCAEDTEIHIINKEALLWIWNNFKKGRDWPYDVIIGDDLREFRSGKKRTARGKDKDKPKGPAPLSRWGVLAGARKYVKAMIELTGTPTPKGLDNMWGLIYLIDLGERLGLNKTAFLKRWFDVDTYTHAIKAKGMKVDKKSGKILEVGWAFDEIMSKVQDVMFSIDPADMAALPDFIIDPIRVKLPTKVLDAYKSFERKMVSEEYDVEAVNGGVLHGKLLQFANGSMYQEDGEDVWIHDAKIHALADLVERLNGTPLLVAYTYQFDVDRICKVFPDAVVLTPANAVETTRLWNEDRIPLLLAHRAAAGHGLNLQKGSGHMCEYGLTSDAELFLQFLKRLLRPGRKTTVFNHVIIAEQTIDEDVFPMYLDPKIETQNRILKAVRLPIGRVAA